MNCPLPSKDGAVSCGAPGLAHILMDASGEKLRFTASWVEFYTQTLGSGFLNSVYDRQKALCSISSQSPVSNTTYFVK